MTLIKLKHIDRFVDRHGRERFYFRRDRGPRIPLPGRPGTPEFMAAYEQAAIGERLEREPKQRGAPGTFDRLVQDYFAAPEFLGLAPSSKKSYRSVIERLIIDEKIAHRLVREMTREHVRRILAKRSETPGAANSVLQKLKVLIHFAIDNGWRKDDPTLRIKKYAKGEFHTWTEEEIAQYERRWLVGTTERLAFALLLYTGQRRSDVVTMSWNDVKDGTICVTPLKTKRTSGVKLWIPIHPALQEVLDAADRDDGTILQTAFGQPFTSNGFGSGFMAVKIDKAGLPKRCVTHGLRKAAARRLAEAGCTANEIAAITGHATLQEVSRYTKAAEQKKLAQSAMRRLSPPKTRSDSQTGPKGLGIPPKKINDFSGGSEAWWSRGNPRGGSASDDALPQPSAWVHRFAGGIKEGGLVTDVACGGGRHIPISLEAGRRVLGLDRDITAASARWGETPRVTLRAVDLEDGSPFPLAPGSIDGLIVTNYLWRPILPAIVSAVAADGVLIYETFMVRQEKLGRPKNPEFLLRPGELLEAVAGRLAVVALEHVRLTAPDRVVQRIAAVGRDHRWAAGDPPALALLAEL